VRVVHNGVTGREFDPVVLDPQARDLVFVGELRALKGVDVLIRAIALLAREGLSVSATIAGDGPDRAAFEALVAKQNAGDRLRFIGATPARNAFALGRFLVVPSRAESLPYVVLEAAAAGVPLIASNVGGIPEILGPDAVDLVPPGDPAALARAIAQSLRNPERKDAAVSRLQARVRSMFLAEVMTDAILDAYKTVMARRHG
jgi:glycosyltransferase involved in cell wall biosynthesis